MSPLRASPLLFSLLAGHALAYTDITGMLHDLSTAITAPTPPSTLPAALTDLNVTVSNFVDFDYKLQHALLWSAGWVRAVPESAGSGDSSDEYVQVHVLCGRTMSDVFQPSKAFDNETECELRTCKPNVILFTEESCSPSYIASKARCALSADLSVPFKTKSGPMWSLDGSIDESFDPQLFQLQSSSSDDSSSSQDDDTSVYMLAQKDSWTMPSCPNSALSIAPCVQAKSSEISPSGTWCVPELDQGVVLWLQDYQAASGTSDGDSSSSSTVAIILGVLLAIFVVVSAVLFVLYRRAQSWSKDGLHESEQNAFFAQAQSHRGTNGHNGGNVSGQYVSNNGPHPSYENAMQIEAVNESFRMRSPELAAFCDDQELMLKRIAFAGIVYREKMTTGPNGEVWRGEYEGQQVAIKCTPAAAIASAVAANGNRGSTALHASALLGDKELKALEDFTKEIRMAAFLDHPNIVHFIGLSWRTLPDLCMVSEYVALGDLAHFLAQPDSKHLTWKDDKLAIAADISNALVYLHSLSPIVLHRDLKSLNVLLTEDLTAKVSDFGLSRETSFDETMTSGVGTLLWTAPEVLRGEHYSEKADIYSFGVVLAELDTCLPPYAYSQGGRKTKGKNDMDWVPLIASGRATPPFRPDCPRSIRDLAAQCLDRDPNNRPPAMQIVYMLRSKIPHTL